MYLRLKAPFASFRPFQSGSFRSTTPVPSPSTLYGLLLNLAGIEQRGDLAAPITLIREDLPPLKIAIGIPEKAKSEIAILSQQLHQYSVGASDKKLSEKTYGAKAWIAPVRREVIVNLDLVIGVQGEKWLCDRILNGLNGELAEDRYGLPFVGDNNFLIDSIEVFDRLPESQTYRWYSPLGQNVRPRHGSCRLTLWIDRANNTKTKTEIFSPSHFCFTPPESAWIDLPKLAS